ncbi:MAG: SLBB domain-containing protein [Acidobacteriota bacterium]
MASTTGMVLPIYGANLFQTVPSTFAPVDMAPVPSNYVIGPGDELRIRVWGQVSFQADVRVDRSGAVYLPHVGPVQVAGLKFSELDSHLRAAVGRVYRNFDLIADMGQIRSIQVYVAGQARRPGVYTVSSLSTLVDALFASGGPSVHGSLRHIELRRGGSVVTVFDLYDLIAHGDKTKDAKLLPEDVIYIPPVGAEVAVTGSVRLPAIYELRPNESLGDLLKDAGGITAVASSARVSIERIENHRDREAMEIAYDVPGLATPLADGDVIHVNSIIPRYQKTVTLRGNIANPGRFAWHKGMRVSELIPDKDSLVTRNYWWRRTQQGLPAPEFEPSADLSAITQPSNPVPLARANAQNQNQMQMQMQRNTGRSGGQPENGMIPNSSMGAAAATENQQMQDQGQPYPPDSQSGQQLPPYGTSQPEQRQAVGVNTTSTLATQQESRYTGLRGATQRTQVSIVAPEIDWDYATIERLDPETLKTKLLPFDLGRLVLNHDQTQNLELQPGDVVTIFSEADIRLPRAQQTKLIKLEGEFVHAGVYTATPGERLRDLVERAGGLTPGAYLYGSEFSRESTRVLQQARIDEYVQSVEMEMQRGSMALIAAGAGNNVDQNGRTAESVAVQQLVARLRQIRATGRIVLEFKPGARGIDAIPDIALEDGDVFVVPAVPSSINVVGAVYNQNSFLYDRARRVSAYLRLAGGPNRNADVHHAFIIRADGEVISRAAMNNLWGDSFESLRLNPGDTIVVPDKAIKVPALRNIMDWSTMFSQLALGAAYLTVLP